MACRIILLEKRLATSVSRVLKPHGLTQYTYFWHTQLNPLGAVNGGALLWVQRFSFSQLVIPVSMPGVLPPLGSLPLWILCVFSTDNGRERMCTMYFFSRRPTSMLPLSHWQVSVTGPYLAAGAKSSSRRPRVCQKALPLEIFFYLTDRVIDS